MPLARFPIRDLSEAGTGRVVIRATLGPNLVPETLRVNLQKTPFLSHSNRDLF